MSVANEMDVLQKIRDIAELAGVKGVIDEMRRCFAGSFTLGEGRSQIVCVRASQHSPSGKQVVTFYSPCLDVKKGFMRGISREQALDLLRRNEKLFFARYGIWSYDDHDMIVASVDQLLDTLDPPEFQDHIWSVACAADAYEREHGGKDVY